MLNTYTYVKKQYGYWGSTVVSKKPRTVKASTAEEADRIVQSQASWHKRLKNGDSTAWFRVEDIAA